MMYEGKKVFTSETFNYDMAMVGDFVDASVVMDAMNCLPPVCMRLTCAQLGEPYSHRFDEANGKFRATFTTFRCVSGDWHNGVWMYCGHCFCGETEEHGKNPMFDTTHS